MPITATAQPGNTPPRVEISLTGLTGATATVTRLDPDGRSRPVRAAEPATLTTGTWLGYDYEMPLDVPVTYTVDATTSAAPVTVSSSDGWLVHPGVPDLSLRLEYERVTQLEDRTRAARAAVLQPLARATPIVVSETRSSVQTGITLLTETLAERDTTWAALAGGSALLLNLPPAWEWGVTWEYIAIGDATEAYKARGLSTARLFTLPYTVVDRPVGSLQAQWTYAGVLTEYATYADVMVAYDTYTDLLANNAN